MSRLALALALVVAPLALPAVARAQDAVQQVVQPEPLAADAPTAKQALALVELLLAGDRGKVDAFLKANGAESFTTSADYAPTLDGLLAELKQGARVVVGQDGFTARRGTGVGVRLAQSAGGETERGVIVQLEPSAPHRVLGVRVAAIRVQ